MDLVSPEEVLLSTEADMLIARSSDGEIAFLPGHIPFIGILKPDTVRVHQSDGQVIRIDVESGFLEISRDQITVLTDKARLEQQAEKTTG